MRTDRSIATFFAPAFFALFLFLVLPVSAGAQDHLPRVRNLPLISSYHDHPRFRESETHPVRLLGYVMHPIGVAIREGIFRPISYLMGSSTLTSNLFGFREPFDYRDSSCFASADYIPNCRKLPPYNSLMEAPDYGSTLGDAPGELGYYSKGRGGPSFAAQQRVFLPDVAFAFNRSSLTSLGKGRVRQIAQLLASAPEVGIEVSGHTDHVGSSDYNRNLGERRAKAVVDELVRLGIDPSRMSPVSYGEDKPVFAEESDWARAVNRRVQFSVRGQ